MTVVNAGQTSTAHLLVPILGCKHQRRETIFFSCVNGCTRLEQFEGALLVTVLATAHQGGETVVRGSVDVGLRLEQFEIAQIMFMS